MSIETKGMIREIPVRWKPEGSSEVVIAIIRNGVASLDSRIENHCFVADLDGCKGFINAIQKAIRDTKAP